MAIKIGTEGVVEFELTTVDGKEDKAFVVDVGKMSMALKAITDEHGDDDRMVADKVQEILAFEILGEPEVRFSYYTLLAFVQAVMEESAKAKKKITGSLPTEEPPATDSTS